MDDSKSIDTTIEQHEYVPIVLNEASDYTIVYAADLLGGENYAKIIKSAILNSTGVELSIASDNMTPKGREILIGNTNRDLSKTSAAYYINFNIYYDKTSQNISLTGDIDSAIQKFYDFALTYGKNGELNLKLELFKSYPKDGYGYAPLFEGGKYKSLTMSDFNSYYLLYYSTTVHEYNEYLQKLESQGFIKYTSRSVNSNLFATYTDGYSIININYLNYYEYVRISVDTIKSSALPVIQQEDFDVKTAPLLIQINGADAFILKLSNGKFIVVDGGLNYEKNWAAIYNQLTINNTLGGKPIIAAWILSHAHSDHLGGFIGFAENYSGKAVIEKVLLNLPSYEIYSQNTEATGTGANMQSLITKVKSILSTQYSTSEIIIPHAGQILWFGDAMVDMLYTHEDLSPTVMKATNSSTLVYTITIKGQRIMFLNDAHNDTSNIIYHLYGKTLKSDIVQVAHHGYNGGDGAMYSSINADVALWTSPYDTIISSSLWNNPRNNFNINSVKENLMMDDNSVMTIKLPYIVGSLPQYARKFP